MSNRADRVKALQQAAKDYIDKEKTRIDNEVQALQAILNGRTGGAGIQQDSQAQVAAVAQNDLASYLKGD